MGGTSRPLFRPKTAIREEFMLVGMIHLDYLGVNAQRAAYPRHAVRFSFYGEAGSEPAGHIKQCIPAMVGCLHPAILDTEQMISQGVIKFSLDTCRKICR